MKKLMLVLTILTVFAIGSAQAALNNPGFETGDLTGWTTYGTANVVTIAINYSNTITYTPHQSYMLQLWAGMGESVATTATQNIALQAGNVLSGGAAFLAYDYIPYTDWGAVKIFNSASNLVATPFFANIQQVGSYGQTLWTAWSWTAPYTDTYSLQYEVANGGDNSLSSYALFDSAVGSPVPLPAAVWLLGAGLVALAGVRKKMNK